MGADLKLVSNTKMICDGDRAYVLEDYNYDNIEEMPDLFNSYIPKNIILDYLQLCLDDIETQKYDKDYCRNWLNKWISWIQTFEDSESFRFYMDNDNEWDKIKYEVIEKYVCIKDFDYIQKNDICDVTIIVDYCEINGEIAIDLEDLHIYFITLAEWRDIKINEIFKDEGK